MSAIQPPDPNQHFNYWLASLESIYGRTLPPKIPQSLDLRDQPKNPPAHYVVRQFFAELDGILGSPEREELIPKGTFTKVYQLAARVLKDTTNIKERRPIQKSFDSLSRVIQTKDPVSFLSYLREKGPKHLSTNELQQLNVFLDGLVYDQRALHLILTREVLMFVETHLLSSFQQLGGVTGKKEGENGFRLEWKYMEDVGPEAIALSARLERAIEEKQFLLELKKATEDQAFFDPKTMNAFHLWQYIAIISAISQFCVKLDPPPVIVCMWELKHVNRSFPEIIKKLKEKEADIGYAHFQRHDEPLTQPLSYKKHLDFLAKNLADIKSCVEKYLRETGGPAQLYEIGYKLYMEGFAYQKSVSFSPPPPISPDKFLQLSLPILDPEQIKSSVSVEPLFDGYCKDRGKELFEVLFNQLFGTLPPCMDDILKLLGFTQEVSSASPPTTLVPPTPPPTTLQKPTITEKHLTQPKKTKTEQHPTAHITKALEALHITNDSSPPVAKEKPQPLAKKAIQEKQPSENVHELPPAPEALPSPLIPSLSSPVTSNVASLPPVIPPPATAHLPQQIQESSEPKCLSVEPCLTKTHPRVRQWMARHRQPAPHTPKEEDDIDFHIWPLFVSKLIMDNSPRTQWAPPTLPNKVNYHYNCVGTLDRYGKGKPPETGYFADCFDGDSGALYHHFFHKSHQSRLISSFRKHGTFFKSKDDPDETAAATGPEQPPIDQEPPTRFEVKNCGAYSLSIDDRIEKIKYTLSF